MVGGKPVGKNGAMEISMFSVGNDPKAEIGLLSKVEPGDVNPHRNECGALTYVIGVEDIGKELSFIGIYYDASTGSEGNRDLGIDRFVFTCSRPVEYTVGLVL